MKVRRSIAPVSARVLDRHPPDTPLDRFGAQEKLTESVISFQEHCSHSGLGLGAGRPTAPEESS
jgi:hypothetical protein